MKLVIVSLCILSWISGLSAQNVKKPKENPPNVQTIRKAQYQVVVVTFFIDSITRISVRATIRLDPSTGTTHIARYNNDSQKHFWQALKVQGGLPESPSENKARYQINEFPGGALLINSETGKSWFLTPKWSFNPTTWEPFDEDQS